jgi:hypothetical protein
MRSKAEVGESKQGSASRSRFIFLVDTTRDDLDVCSGSIATKISQSGHFRLSLNSGSTGDIVVGPVRAITGRDLWWIKIQLACSVSACSGVTVAGLQNHL